MADKTGPENHYLAQEEKLAEKYARFVIRFRWPVILAILVLTVAGALEEPRTRTIGEFPYRFPVVLVREHHLWEPLPPRRPCHLCDPFWWYWQPWDPYRRRW